MSTDFTSIFRKACARKDPHTVWADFLYCSAAAISNSVYPRMAEKRKERYMEIVGAYTKAEAQLLARLLGITTLALDDEPHDFLGQKFHELELHNKWKGQFFTPQHLSDVMAEMTLENIGQTAKRKGWVSISDPAVGAGVTLISAFKIAKAQGLGHNDMIFHGQDIDQRALLMAYIQLSLLGVPAVFVLDDTLRAPTVGPDMLASTTQRHETSWFTPAYFYANWEHRLRTDKPARSMKVGWPNGAPKPASKDFIAV